METKDIETLRGITAARADIKRKIDALNISLKAINETAKEVMSRMEIEKWTDDFGMLTIKPGYQVAALQKDKLIQSMLCHGIPAATVDEIIKEGSNVTTRAASVEFRVNVAAD